jgi:hypothetical protein
MLTRSLQSIFGRASMSSSSDGSDPSLAGKLAAVAELRAVAEEVSRHIETVVTREDVLRPAREALAAAEKKKQLGNDGFRKGDFLAAYAEYMEAHKALDVASAEPTTAYAAEVLRLTVLANTAQCALKTGQPSAAANFCRDAVKLSVCVNDETLFKKILVRLAQAHEQMGEREKALAVAHEAQLRGVNADEFFALTEKHGVENVGALEPGVEARMFVMLAIRLSAGPENLERVRSVLQTGKLPHVDRRDEAGFNMLWGVLQALGVEEGNPDGVEGGEACVPALALLFRAGADPRQRYEKGGKTPLMYACGSGLVSAARAVLSAPGGVGPFDNAAIDAPDDGGWTALLVACAGPPGAKKEAGAARSGPDAAAVVRLLLDRGADPRVQNAQGNDALMIAAINGNADVVAELLAPPPAGGAGERKHTGPELTRARNSVGMSAYVLASKAGNAGVATDVLAAARACGGVTAAEAEEDVKMIKLVALLDTVAAAHNDALEATLRSAPTPEAGAALAATPFATAETEAARVVALLAESGFELPDGVDKHDAPRAALEAYGDVYSALHRRVADATPAALTKTWQGTRPLRRDLSESDANAPTRAEAASVYWFTRGEFAEGHRLVDASLEAAAAQVPSENRGGSASPLVVATEHGVRVPPARLGSAAEALRHAFAFAVPCAAALDAVAALRVGVVEVGCGTAYWACLLRERGVDVVAYDARPPARPSAERGDGENAFFGAAFADDVERGGPEVLRSHADRALFLCWPVRPEEAAHGDEARDEPWDAACLDHWHGDTLIHVGEWTSRKSASGDARARVSGNADERVSGDAPFPRGTSLVDHPAGLTTSRQFQDAVEAGFELQKVVRLPNWPDARDDLTVWVRKKR